MHDLPKAPSYQFKGDSVNRVIRRRRRTVVLTEITNVGVQALLKEDASYWGEKFFLKKTSSKSDDKNGNKNADKN